MLFAILVLAPFGARAEDVLGVPLPRGARRVEGAEGQLYASPRGFRATLDFYRKTLAKRGVAAELRPVERVRDVTFARILSTSPGAPWSAVHVVLAEGRTTIYIVAASDNPIGDRLTAGRRTLDPSI